MFFNHTHPDVNLYNKRCNPTHMCYHGDIMVLRNVLKFPPHFLFERVAKRSIYLICQRDFPLIFKTYMNCVKGFIFAEIYFCKIYSLFLAYFVSLNFCGSWNFSKLVRALISSLLNMYFLQVQSIIYYWWRVHYYQSWNRSVDMILTPWNSRISRTLNGFIFMDTKINQISRR